MKELGLKHNHKEEITLAITYIKENSNKYRTKTTTELLAGGNILYLGVFCGTDVLEEECLK